MSAQIDAAKNEADKYAGTVLHYSHNAENYLRTKDSHKAGEMMWGAMSCALKTVAAKRNKFINGHRALKICHNIIQARTRQGNFLFIFSCKYVASKFLWIQFRSFSSGCSM